MKINELMTESQIDELSLGGIGRGLAKGVGGFARGAGALAGGLAGAGAAARQGYAAGRSAVSGQTLTHSNGRSIKKGEQFDAVTGKPLPQASEQPSPQATTAAPISQGTTPTQGTATTSQTTNPFAAPTVPQRPATTTNFRSPTSGGITTGGSLLRTGSTTAASKAPQAVAPTPKAAAPQAAKISPEEQQWEANLKKQGMTPDEIEKARPAYRARQNRPLPQAGGTTLAANRPAMKSGDYDWAGGGVGPDTKIGDIKNMQKPTSESVIFYSKFLGQDI